MDFSGADRVTTAIYIRLKRGDDTWFVLCDEYETVESLMNRILIVLAKVGLQLPKQEEPFTIDDLRLWIRNRVSNVAYQLTPTVFKMLILFRVDSNWTGAPHATTSKFLMTQRSTFAFASRAPRTPSTT